MSKTSPRPGQAKIKWETKWCPCPNQYAKHVETRLHDLLDQADLSSAIFVLIRSHFSSWELLRDLWIRELEPLLGTCVTFKEKIYEICHYIWDSHLKKKVFARYHEYQYNGAENNIRGKVIMWWNQLFSKSIIHNKVFWSVHFWWEFVKRTAMYF